MKKLILSLPLFLLPLLAFSQYAGCVKFEDSTFYTTNIPTSQIDFGAVFYTESDVKLRVKYENHANTGISDLGFVNYETSGWNDYNSNFFGNVMTMGDVTVQLDFSSLPYGNKTIIFDISLQEAPDEVNPFNVNGAGYQTLPNGISYDFINLNSGLQVLISGPINTIELWGFEVAVDNICFLPMSTQCLDLASLGNGNNTTLFGASTGYAPGDLLTNMQDVNVTLQNYNCDGVTSFEDFYVFNNISFYNFISNFIKLKFDFSDVASAVNAISFTAWTDFCININGGASVIVESGDTPDLSAFSAEVSVEIDSSSNNWSYTYTFYGTAFETFSFGGLDMPWTNFCYNTVQNCEISNLTATTYPCIDMDHPYYVQIDADYYNTSDSFNIRGNGNDYGYFSYADLPITLGPFEPGQTINEFVLIDKENSNCKKETALVIAACECNIEIQEYVVAECFQGEFYLLVYYTYENPFSEMHVFVNGDFYEGDIFQSGTLVLGPFAADGQSSYKVLLTDAETDQCFAEFSVTDVLCDDNCLISNVVAEPQPCNPNGVYYIDLDADYLFTSDSFNLRGNGHDYGMFSYADLPITLGPFQQGDIVNEFVLIDQEHPDCKADVGFQQVACFCDIEILEYEILECGNSQYYLLVQFIYEGPFSEMHIYANGEFLEGDIFESGEIFLGPFVADGQTSYEILFTDAETDDCRDVLFMESVTCGNTCSITNVHADPTECDADGHYYVELTFSHANTGNSGFMVIGDGMFYGMFEYNQLPLRLGPFASGGPNLEFNVFDVENPMCIGFAEIESQECPSECELLNLHVNFIECDGQIAIYELDFEHYNTASDSFLIYLNGIPVFTIAYNDLPFHFTSTSSQANVVYELKVCDLESPNCCAYTTFETTDDCSTGDCQINDLIVEAHSCDGNHFLVDLDFNHSNTSDSFNVLVNGQWYGPYLYDDLYLTIGPFEANGPTNFNFVVVDAVYDDCVAEYNLEVDCGNSGNCDISNLEVYALECTSDSTYAIKINFNYQNPGNDFFDVYYANGEFLGFFALNDLPVVVDNFIASGNAEDVLIVCINDNPNCCEDVAFEALNCGDECKITDLIVEAYDCDGDYFLVDLNFNVQNPISDSFVVVGNGQFHGTFSYEDLYITLGPFIGNGQTAYEFIVFDAADERCHAVFELGKVDCDPNGDCQITDLVVDALECTSDSTYAIKINFNYQNATNDFFDVIGPNGDFIGFFALSDLPIIIDDFIGTGNAEDFIVVCINDTPNCCAEVVFEALNCGGDCQITDLTVEALECTSDTTYAITIDFNAQNPGNDFFDVFGPNGDLIGFYALSDLPVTITNFVGSGQSFDFIHVCINDNPNCCAGIDFEALDCGPIDCELNNPTVYPVDCNPDGTYSLVINFDYENVLGDQFVLSTSGNVIGTFSYNDLPLFLNSFPTNGTGVDEITICDIVNDDCCISFEFEGLICEDCEIFELEAEATDCDNGLFFVELNFDYQNVGPIGFQVLGNGQNYGNFDYADLPITLGPFQSGTTDLLEFIIFDLINFNCTNFIEINAPVCSQPIDFCLDFENLEDSLVYGSPINAPGDLFFESNGVLVKYAEFVDLQGSGGFGDIFVNDDNLSGLDYEFNLANDNYLIFSRANILLDFSELPLPVNRLSFDYHTKIVNPFGIIFNLGVNDAPLHAYETVTDLPETIAPGVQLSINLNPNDPNEGTIVLTGNIKTFKVGGTNFAVDNICYTTEEPFSPVWPGDINLDNQANHVDLLSLGIAYGFEGPERLEINSEWDAMSAADWTNDFDSDEINFKHADCNGDGLVDEKDRAVIDQNYGLSHDIPLPFEGTKGTVTDPPLYVDLEAAGLLFSGNSFSAPIKLGTPNLPVEDIYGLAFTIRFDPQMINPASVGVEVGNSFMGNTDVDLMSIDRTFANEGIIEVAICRNDHEPVSGNGTIAAFIGIIDNVGGKSTMEVSLHELKSISNDESPVPLYMRSSVIDLPTGIDEPGYYDLRIYPNPTSDYLNILNLGQEEIQQIKVYNALGQLMVETYKAGQLETLAVENWAAGIYFIDIQLEHRNIRSKFKVTRQ